MIYTIHPLWYAFRIIKVLLKLLIGEEMRCVFVIFGKDIVEMCGERINNSSQRHFILCSWKKPRNICSQKKLYKKMPWDTDCIHIHCIKHYLSSMMNTRCVETFLEIHLELLNPPFQWNFNEFSVAFVQQRRLSKINCVYLSDRIDANGQETIQNNYLAVKRYLWTVINLPHREPHSIGSTWQLCRYLSMQYK